MKLLRFGTAGNEQPGLLDAAGQIRSLVGVVNDIAGATLSAASLDHLRKIDLKDLPVVKEPVRLGPCVGGVGKMMCIGLNYAEHAAETGAQLPKEPVLFMKATSAISGPNDDIQIPRGSKQTDWEVELGVVIGEKAKYVSEDDALNYVAGYCVSNDVSEREFQKERGGQWTKGKSCDTFGPIGPWLVTEDEVSDPQNLSLWLEVDGKRRQDGSTKTMIFGVKKVVSYLSQFMTLHPGDVISTGTPSGVGMGCKPPEFLRPGQTVRLSVEGLGEQQQRTIQG
ncbi:MAG TPA: fumarylacetoacetate hydrolase family protein [Pirellulales bacterium]|jgi:2-keto-4-pentenoate hydratase/2-oxohepta-3-ene-1,7-dioic acid hydratase in catechol pathway